MSYEGAQTASEARDLLGEALEALQADPKVPEEVMAIASNIAQSVGALFEAQNATSPIDGRASVRAAMGYLSQTMALLQDVRGDLPGVQVATQALARVMSKLYPLSQAPSMRPPSHPPAAASAATAVPAAAPVPSDARPVSERPPSAPGERAAFEANVGATTESNFFVGFSGDIAEGGVFVGTYLTAAVGDKVDLTLTLPGGFEQVIAGTVRFVRDPMDMDSEPGIGVGFDRLSAEQRELILRFVRKRPPLFYDD
ncbi:MAG: PilZ domain-containing protein [Myxococcales bacterium]|nr:PilZ domain-containing protein [Myxococcales bacterium]